jgi:hypothetical protein
MGMSRMFKFFIATILLFLSLACSSTKSYRVSGTLTDFNGKPLAGGEVHFQDKNFKNIVSVITNEMGEFSALLPEKQYNSIFACKDYAKNYLEYWHWNFKPKENDFLDIKIDGLELYGMKVWSTEPTYKSLIIYFRPMSLKRALAIKKLDKKQANPVTAELRMDGITAMVDGKNVEIFGMNKMKEFMSKDQNMEAYTVQISTKNLTNSPQRVCLTLTDAVTKERGMGCVDL